MVRSEALSFGTRREKRRCQVLILAARVKAMSESIYKRTLTQLMLELDQAICEDRAHAAMWNCYTSQGLTFFRVAYYALSNDVIAHAIKILDRWPAPQKLIQAL